MISQRTERLLAGLDPARMNGIEIGAWTRPIVRKSAGWKTTVVDFAATDELHAIAANHSSPDMRALAAGIEEVDVVWRGEPLDDLLLPLHPTGVDYIVASHVLEHTPDLLSTLQQLERLLTDRGVISLALPDKRFCFDVFRPISLTHDLLLAHRKRRTRHSAETLFASYAYQGTSAGYGGWPRHRVADIAAVKQLKRAYEIYWLTTHVNGAPSAYVDAHAWVFVPASFELILLELNALGLINLRIRGEVIEEAESEFVVQLERGPVELSTEEVEERREALLLEINKPHTSDYTLRDYPELIELRRENGDLRAYSQKVDAVVRDTWATVGERDRQIAELESALIAERSERAYVEKQLALRRAVDLARRQDAPAVMTAADDNRPMRDLLDNLEANEASYRTTIAQYQVEREALRADGKTLRAYIDDIERRYNDLFNLSEARHKVIGNLQSELQEQRVDMIAAAQQVKWLIAQRTDKMPLDRD